MMFQAKRVIRAILFGAVLICITPHTPVQAAPQFISDANATIEKLDGTISTGDTQGLTDALVVLMGIQEQKDSLASAFAYFKGKKPDVSDKVFDKTYGTSIRRIVTYHSYSDMTVLYARYTLKRFKQGWVLVNFDYKTETQQLFPPDYIGP
jgi:hypothetical protein